MKKKMKLKRNKIIKTLNFILFLILTLFSFITTYKVLNQIKLYSSNEEFIMALLNDSNHHLKYNNSFLNKVSSFISNISIKEPVSILENAFYYKKESKTELVYNDNYNPEDLNSSYIADPNPQTIESPSVYIYNSHQLENYSAISYEAYNITPNVLMASYLLREKLNNLGIKSITEESDITEFIRINNWNYNYSYLASRYYIEDAMKKNPSLNFFIDIHRDALNKASSTITIDNKNYARILFVVGLEHSNYQKNLDLANSLNTKFNEKYPNLSRGVLTKKGADVDGVYNQDLSPNMILLEIGGQDNTIDEVFNSIEVIANILKEYLNGKK